MLVERREQAIAIWIGSTGNGRNPIANGRRQPSCDGTSRMNSEVHVRICERLGVKCPGLTLAIASVERCRHVGFTTRTYRCEATNRRFGPMSAFCTAENPPRSTVAFLSFPTSGMISLEGAHAITSTQRYTDE